VQGNIIGLNSAGVGSLPNGNAGVGISDAAANQIGGSSVAARNIISANGDAGIFMIGSGTDGNQIQGNFIGTDLSGTLARGNTYEGIYMQANANLIGGTAMGAGNLISANNTRGIWLTNASRNTIQGNFIGTKADGTSALGNVDHGIDIDVNATNNTVGGLAAGAGNRIAFAQTLYSGVRVRDGSRNNLISGNSIFSNGALGIDLGTFGPAGIYTCESGIAANAANAGQNFPILSNVYDGTIIRVRGSMPGAAGKTYSLEFFASPSGDTSGYGEGQVFLGQTNVTLGATCSANFTAYLPASVPSNWVVTATATDSANNTSEFSKWISMLPIPLLQPPSVFSNQQISISWTNNGGNFALQQTFDLTPPVQWFDVTNAPLLTNHFFVTTLAPTNNVFYRLIAP
ncbi:MAG: right-handed parallel beta-helix repeat-containing protein, partial [Limisphaerales bacterium]